MRDVKGLVYETSLLDPLEGIRFRGLSIPEVRKKLPKVNEEPLPEGIFYLLLTGEVPSDEQAQAISAEWSLRAKSHRLPERVITMIKNCPKDLHPMTQFSMALMAIQNRSIFAKEYAAGRMNKADMWTAAYEDTCNLLAILPDIASLIYQSNFEKQAVETRATDWAGKFAGQLGFSDEKFAELLRLYLTIHADHEGEMSVHMQRNWLDLLYPIHTLLILLD